MSHAIAVDKCNIICSYLEKHDFTCVKEDIQENTNELYEILINGKIEDTYENPIYYCYCGIYYSVNNNIVTAKKYYLKAIEKDNGDAMNNYAFLLEEERDIVNAKKYYLKAIEKDNSDAMNNYALLLKEEGDIATAKIYYLKAIEKGNDSSMYNYAYLLEEEGDIPNAKIYYLKAIEKDNDFAMYNYQKISNKYEQYNSLSKLTSKPTIKEMQLLLSDNDIHLFKRRIEKTGTMGTCVICLEDDKTIITTPHCFHELCTNCYVQVDKCPICRVKIN